MLCFQVVLFLSLSLTVENQLSNNNYGPYDIVWEKYVTCKGPKPTDCGKVRLENTDKNMSDVIFVLDFSKDCPVTKARVILGNSQRNTTKKFMNYSLDSPCQHFVLGPILTQSFNLAPSNCKISKGYYEVHVNMNEKVLSFLGTSFFYGRYTFKVYAHSRVNNFFCIETTLLIEKKV